MSTFSSFVMLFFLANFSVFDILCVDILFNDNDIEVVQCPSDADKFIVKEAITASKKSPVQVSSSIFQARRFGFMGGGGNCSIPPKDHFALTPRI